MMVGHRSPRGGWRRRAVCGVCLAAMLALVPIPAAAQGRHQFAVALVELTEALDGAHGDERERARAAFDAMERSLAQWNHEVRLVETQVADGLATAAPDLVVPMHLGLALTLLERGRVADARAAIDRALAVAPEDPDVHFLLGRLLLSGDPAGAVRAFRRAWEIDPSRPVTAFWLVHTAHMQGLPDAAQAVSGTLTAMYRQIAGAENLEAAVPFRDQALVSDGAADAPVLPLVRYQDGFNRIAAGDYDGGLAQLRAAAEGDPLLTDAALETDPFRRGAEALKAGDVTAAIERFGAAAALMPQSSEVHRMHGLAYGVARRVPEARAAFETALRLDARNERAHIDLVALLTAAGLVADAFRAIDAALEALPSSGTLHWEAALLRLRSDDPDEVLRHLEAIPLQGVLVGKGHVLSAMAALHADAGRAPAAIDAMRRRVFADPNSLPSQLALAELCQRARLHASALASFVAALMIAPGTVEAHTGVGYVHLAAGAFDEAEVAFRRALALRPDSNDPRYGLVTALERLGRREEAAAELDALRGGR